MYVLTELDGNHVANVWVFASREKAQRAYDDWWDRVLGRTSRTEEEREDYRLYGDYDLYLHEEEVQ